MVNTSRNKQYELKLENSRTQAYISTSLLKNFKGLIDDVSNVLILSLRVINDIANVPISVFEQIKHRKQLSVVRNQRFSNLRVL